MLSYYYTKKQIRENIKKNVLTNIHIKQTFVKTQECRMEALLWRLPSLDEVDV